MCNVLASDSSLCVLLEDFNEDLVDQCLAKGLASTFSLAQHITKATCITVTSVTPINHVYTLNLINFRAGVTEQHIADHKAVWCTLEPHLSIQYNTQKHTVHVYRSMKNIDYETLGSNLSSVSRMTVIDADTNVNNMVKNFSSCLIDVWNKHAPLITRRTRKCCTPWMHVDVLNLKHKRKYEYKKFLRSRTNESS